MSQPEIQTVIDALYDLPLGGEWRALQEALCKFWHQAPGQVDERQIRTLEQHFDRALTFLEKMPPNEHRWRNELFRIPLPACVFDAGGNLIDINPPGTRFLQCEGDALPVFPGNAAASVRATIRELQPDSIGVVQLTTNQRDELTVFVSSFPEQLHAESGLFLGVFVSRTLPAHGAQLLATQYQLTNAEANLCMALSSGQSLDDVTRSSTLKKSTLRTHLANCFAKLGVNSQPELVALVLHSLFASAQLTPSLPSAKLTAYLDPELHGHPRFIRHTLADGRVLGCLEYGDPDGIPAIYFHGSFGSGLFMKSQKLHGNGVRMLAVERFGVGETSVSDDLSPQAYARDVLQLVDALGIDQFAVIGRSMGSWDAVSLTLAVPERARLLVLAGGRLPVQDMRQHSEEGSFYTSLFNGIWNSDAIGRLMLQMLFVQLQVRGPQAIIGREPPVGIEGALNEDALYARHMRASWLRCAVGGTEPLHAHLKLYKHPVADPPWLGLSTPTLLVHGLEDRVINYQRIIDQTSSFRQRTVKLLPGVGHRLVQLAMGEVLRSLRNEWENLTAR